jgi:hypothetical protein
MALQMQLGNGAEKKSLGFMFAMRKPLVLQPEPKLISLKS